MKRVLIVSPYFAPESSVASIRFTKIAKYLQRMGYDVTVLRTDIIKNAAQNPVLQKDAQEVARVVTVNYTGLHYKLQALSMRMEQRAAKTAGHAPESAEKPSLRQRVMQEVSVWLSEYRDQKILARRFYKIVKQLCADGGSFDTVITTYSPLAPMLLAKRLKTKGLCRLWIADYRDAISHLRQDTPAIRLLQKTGAKCTAYADIVTAVSEGTVSAVRRDMARYAGTEKPAQVITNGYDPEDRRYCNAVPPQGKLVFCYCGAMYRVSETKRSDASPLFRALSKLAGENRIDMENVRVQYAGKYAQTFLAQAEAYGLRSIVLDSGFVSFAQSLALQAGSDIVLSLVWNTAGDEGTISGKFYEALLAERNTLALVAGDLPDSEIARMVRRHGNGFCYEQAAGNMEALECYIEECYKQKLSSGCLAYDTANEAAGLFSHVALAARFAQIIENEEITK